MNQKIVIISLDNDDKSAMKYLCYYSSLGAEKYYWNFYFFQSSYKKLLKTFYCISIWMYQKLSFDSHYSSSLFTRHYLCRDYIIVQKLFTQRFRQKNMELLLTVTMRQCSLLCKTVYFHYSLYYYECTIHHLVFSLSYAYIYDICMSRKRQALGKTLGETRSKTLSSSQPTKYQPPFLSKSLISPQKSLPCIRKK